LTQALPVGAGLLDTLKNVPLVGGVAGGLVPGGALRMAQPQDARAHLAPFVGWAAPVQLSPLATH
ncbi:hypothetical protein HII36_46800, partial [Nonomuraea sp. NN258]|uniref:hypothetical protein n=1 Tax=Nonomuraea antri TaxID=2730852 RepID=UPI0015697166